MSLDIIHTRYGDRDPERAFVETWEERKRRRAGQPLAVRPRSYADWRAEVERREAEARRARDAERKGEERRIETERAERCRVASERLAVRIAGFAPRSRILAEVAAAHGVTVDDLRAPTRRRHVAWARHEVAYRLRAETTMSYRAIGQILGGRHGSTARHAVRAHAGRNGLPVPGGVRHG